jgi:hypothetical protein
LPGELLTTGVAVKLPQLPAQAPGELAVITPGNSKPTPVTEEVTPTTNTLVTENVIDPFVSEIMLIVACRFGSELPLTVTWSAFAVSTEPNPTKAVINIPRASFLNVENRVILSP